MVIANIFHIFLVCAYSLYYLSVISCSQRTDIKHVILASPVEDPAFLVLHTVKLFRLNQI